MTKAKCWVWVCVFTYDAACGPCLDTVWELVLCWTELLAVHYLHTSSTADWAFSFEQFPHKSVFCSTFPPAYFRAMLLTCLCQLSSFLCWFTQPVANSPFLWTHSLQAKLSVKCSFLSAEPGKASEEPSPDARGLSACRVMMPPPDPAARGWALLQCLTQLPSPPRCRAGPDEQTDRLWKDYVV